VFEVIENDHAVLVSKLVDLIECPGPVLEPPPDAAGIRMHLQAPAAAFSREDH
jgi:hypothetical protein